MNKRTIPTLFLAVILCGCASILPGNDPLVVNAERTAAISLEVFDVFLKFEYDNREALAKISPDINRTAETIRRNGKNWILTLRAVTRSYKQNRTPEGKFALITALSVVQTAIAESQKYMSVKP